MDALQNLLGVENNQVLIRKYELIGTTFEYDGGLRLDEVGRIIEAFFIKYPNEPDDISNLECFDCFDIFTLKENFMLHLFEEPVDNITWLRIKQPGTYTIHFDLICNSFSFELHTRGEIIHFSEHNPKHNINLEKGENCLLVYKIIPQIIRAGSKIYVYYNI